MLVEDESIMFEELLAYKHSTHVEVADRILNDLIAQARESSNSVLEVAAEVLENWDRTTDANSTGGIIIHPRFEQYTQHSGFDIFAVEFDINNPFSTPSGLSDPIAAIATLPTVAEQIQNVYTCLLSRSKAMGGRRYQNTATSATTIRPPTVPPISPLMKPSR